MLENPWSLLGPAEQSRIWTTDGSTSEKEQKLKTLVSAVDREPDCDDTLLHD